MKKSFDSCFATDLEIFIQTKRQNGFLYESAEYILHLFDSFCTDRQLCNSEITKNLINDWLACYDGNCAVTIAGRASVIRQFSLYLLSIGKNAYIPSQKFRGKRRLAHVLSDLEIVELFEQIDHYVPDIEIPSFHRLAMEYRVLFRLLICCGLRVSEARKLKKVDVSLKEGILIIRCSKGNKNRIVYLPEDLRELCLHYTEQMQSFYSDSSEWFFPAREMDNLLSVGIIDRRFNLAWKSTSSAGICPDKPTVHSLRHTFVVKRMNQWMKENIPLNSMLPYLSKYLGHSSVEDTFYYYHQIDAAFQIVRSKDNKSKMIIPEVTDYEDDTIE
jgi:integrase/recombinase XerD